MMVLKQDPVLLFAIPRVLVSIMEKKAEFLVIYPKKNCFELNHYVVKLIRNPAIENKTFFEINIAPCLIRKLFILVSVT